MPSIRKALALSFAGKYSSLVIHTAAVMVLARLLTPAEIGVYSVGAAVVALAHVLRDFGVGNYLIQEKELTQDRIRTAFGVALAIAWTMAAAVFALSGPAADFYAEPGLGQVLRVLSLTFLVIPFGSPVLALLQRDMAFGRLYVIAVASALAHVTTGITLATLGFGFMSLAWASLSGAAMTTAIAVLNRPKIACLLPSFKEWRRVAGFGSQAAAISFLGVIGMRVPELIIGRALGFTALGLFSRAQGLYMLYHRSVLEGVTPVLLPALASKIRSGEAIKEPYIRGISYLTVLSWPFYGLLALIALPVIRVLFGYQWDEAAPLVRLLCIAGIITPFIHLNPATFVAIGQINRNLRIQTIIQPLRLSLVFGASFISLEAVAAVIAIPPLLNAVISHHYLAQSLNYRFSDLVAGTRKSFTVAVFSLMAPAALILETGLQPEESLAVASIAIGAFCIGWLLGVWITEHPIKGELKTAARAIHRWLAARYLPNV